MTYPEHEKLKALGDSNQIVGDFIEWLSEQGYEICRWNDSGTHCLPVHLHRDQMLADFFEIDRDKLEAEKRQMLDALRAA
jgi:hypothetical protein